MNGRSYADTVNRTIVPGDTMYAGDSDYYFKVGESAVSVIDACLSATGMTKVTSVLDYACGYGRVLRWLKVRFPGARILASDVDKRALASVESVLGVETRVTDVECDVRFDEMFDLIWTGSLFTHLREGDTLRVLAFLLGHLSPAGILVFTTHGPYVARRILTGEKLYELQPDAADQLIADYMVTGYGFGERAGQPAYGISVVTPAKMMGLVEMLECEPLYYHQRGWIQHQDIYAVRATGAFAAGALKCA